MDECVKTLCAWRDTRKKLTGLSTKGPNGFIANKTICCLETNMLTMKEVLVMVERHSQYLQNGHALKVYTLLNRHTDNSRSPAPDIAVPRQALCYLSRSNRGLKNLRLFLQHPLFLALVNSGNHKLQNTEPSKRIMP